MRSSDCRLTPLIICPPSDVDLANLCDWITSPALLLQWAGGSFTFPLTLDALRKHQAHALAQPATTQLHAGFEREDGALCGYFEFVRMNALQGTAGLGRVITDPARAGDGQKLGQRLLSAALDLAFGPMALVRVDLYVLPENARAIQAYERSGFRHEGRLREAMRGENGRVDLLLMAALASDRHAAA